MWSPDVGCRIRSPSGRGGEADNTGTYYTHDMYMYGPADSSHGDSHVGSVSPAATRTRTLALALTRTRTTRTLILALTLALTRTGPRTRTLTHTRTRTLILALGLTLTLTLAPPPLHTQFNTGWL